MKPYAARDRLLAAANRCLMADRLDHSGANDAAEQEYADDMLFKAAEHYVEATRRYAIRGHVVNPSMLAEEIRNEGE